MKNQFAVVVHFFDGSVSVRRTNSNHQLTQLQNIVRDYHQDLYTGYVSQILITREGDRDVKEGEKDIPGGPGRQDDAG